VTVAGIEFRRVVYDAEADVLYLHVGDPHDDRDWDESPEGDGISYGADGRVLGFTILNARERIEQDGKIEITVPQRRIEITDLRDVLVTA
jgi:uncharacterized protein YuzE